MLRFFVCLVTRQNGKPLAGAGGLFARSATFSVLTENPAYLTAVAVTRLPFLAITVSKCYHSSARDGVVCDGGSGDGRKLAGSETTRLLGIQRS